MADYNTLVPRAQIKNKLRKFDNIITVAKTGDADYVCSDEASDYACISAAITDAVSAQTIMFLDGTYDITTPIESVGKSFSWVGQRNVIMNLSGGSADSGILRFFGDHLLDTAPSVDAAMYSLNVTLLNITGVQVGDLINIFNTDQWCAIDYPTQTTGEMYEIVAIDSGTSTVTISQPLYRAYLASNTTIKIYRPSKFNLSNITFVGTGREVQTTAFTMMYASHSKIENCKFLNFGKRAVNLATCYDVLVSNNTIRGCAYTGYGYGVNIGNASAFIKIDKNEIADCRHTVASGTSGIIFGGASVGAYEGLNRCVVISNNLLIGANMSVASHTIDSHPMTIDYTVTNNKIYPGRYLDTPYYGTYAFYNGTQTAIFSDNVIHGGGGVMRRMGGPSGNVIVGGNTLENTRGMGLYNGYHDNNHPGCLVSLEIFNNQVKSAFKTPEMTTHPGYPIIYLGREDYRSVVVSGNTVNGCTLEAIRVEQVGSVSTGTINLNITDNVLSNVGRDGIYISRDSASTALYSHIHNNTITDVAQEDAVYRGIALVDVSTSRVEENTIINSPGTCDSSIKEISDIGNAVKNNIIKNNTISGATNGIVKVGTGTEVIDNEGYNPVGWITALSIPASDTQTRSNQNGYPCQVYITGGTVTAIKINNVATGITSGLVTLLPLDTISMTYSVAPTWTWRGV